MTEDNRLIHVLSYDETHPNLTPAACNASFYNLVMNELLQEHNTIDKQNYLLYCPCSFSLDRYYFAITGLKKSIYTGIYGLSSQEYRTICKLMIHEMEDVLLKSGYHFEIFMLTVDGTKQLGLFFSPQDDSTVAPEDLGEQLLQIQQEFCKKHIFHEKQDYAVQFAMTEVLHGIEDLRKGYLQARSLSDSAFFRMVPAVFTERAIHAWTKNATYHATIEQCKTFAKALTEGDGVHMEASLKVLFLHTLKNSFDFTLLRDVLSYIKYLFNTKVDAYDLHSLPIKEIFHHQSYLTIESLYAAIQDAARKICRAVQAQGVYQNSVSEAIGFIKRHYADPRLSLTMIADYAAVSPSYLSRMFNHQVGCTVYDYIQNIRLRAAAQMLIDTEAKVKEIASGIGIPDTRYFSALFKKKYGVTPQQYRKANDLQ